VFRACTGRQTPPTTPATEGWVVCGRRSGKSRTASAIATYLAALAPTDALAAGEWGVVLVCAVDKVQAGVVLSYIKALFDGIPALRPLVVEEAAESLTLRHGVKIEVRSSNYRRVRGVTLLAAIIDELAFLRDEASALPDVELYRALKPSLMTTNGLILGISSLWAQRGLLWSKYKRHFGQDGPVLVWQADSRTMNPGLSAALIAEATEDDPEAAAAEWQGVFRSDLESYISTAALDAITTAGVVERPPVSGVSYQAFLDVAAGSGKDSFTAAIGHAEQHGDVTVAVLDAVREVRPPFDPYHVAGEVAQTLRAYGCREAQADKFAGAWVTTAFERHGITVTQDAEPKSQLYLAALPLLQGGRCDLLDMSRLRGQLAALERRRRAGGRDVVDHPPAGFDDVANSVVGVLLRAIGGAGWWAQPPRAGEVDFAGNVAPERRTRVLERDGRNELEWMSRSGI